MIPPTVEKISLKSQFTPQNLVQNHLTSLTISCVINQRSRADENEIVER